MAQSLCMWLLLAVFLLQGGQLLASAQSLPTVYVATSGNDTWSGLTASYVGPVLDANGTVIRVDGPVRSIPAGLRVARTLYGSSQIKRVRVAPGYYPQLTDSVLLTAADSNTTLYAEDKTPGRTVITGAVYIPASAIEPVSMDGLGARIPGFARSSVRQVDLTALGLTTDQLTPLATDHPGSELFFKTEAQTLARWPNKPDYVLCRNVSTTVIEVRKVGYNNVTSWPSYANVWVHGFFGQNWYDDRRAIQAVDVENKVITVATDFSYPPRTGQRFYYYNVIDELDEAGEYYIDYDNNVLYFYPPSAITSDTDVMLSIHTKGDRGLIDITSADGITVSGFTIEGTLGHGVRIASGSDNIIKKCTIRNVGNTGILISDGENNLVMASEIFNTGRSAVVMSGGDRITLTPTNHMAFANHVHDFSRFMFCYQPAFGLSGVGSKVINNKIHTAPHNAINLDLGNNHEIYFNEVYDVCKETSDVGAFYQGRDWTSQGTFISYNYFHDIFGYGHEGVSAIYFDDENSGSTAFGNIIVNLEKGVLLGGGRSNRVDNNVFINITDTALYADARGLPGQGPQNNDTLYYRLSRVPYQSETWSQQYPELVHILEDPISPHVPRYNSFRHNVACLSKNLQRLSTAARPYILNVTADNYYPIPSNTTTCEKGVFEGNLASGSLTLRAGAAFRSNITFSQIPTWRIGLDNAYAALPAELPGLKYGSIVTPSEESDCMDEDCSAASGLTAGILGSALRLLLQFCH